MDFIASFSSQKVNNFHFFLIHGLIGKDDLAFLFDTGAACSVVGVNNLFRKGADPSGRMNAFEKLLRYKLISHAIPPRPMKTANRQEVTTYPCVSHQVSIADTEKRDFYFDISFDEINIPLLGSSFIDDCAYHHAISGNLCITSIKEQAGSSFYNGRNTLDFDMVVTEFENRG